jgi:hypothetical protein
MGNLNVDNVYMLGSYHTDLKFRSGFITDSKRIIPTTMLNRKLIRVIGNMETICKDKNLVTREEFKTICKGPRLLSPMAVDFLTCWALEGVALDDSRLELMQFYSRPLKSYLGEWVEGTEEEVIRDHCCYSLDEVKARATSELEGFQFHQLGPDHYLWIGA